MNTLNKLILLAFILVIRVSYGQDSFWVKSTIIEVTQDTLLITEKNSFNAFSLRMNEDNFPISIPFEGGKVRKMSKDDHVYLKSKFQSNLYICDETQKLMLLIFDGYRGPIEWITQYVSPLSIDNYIAKRAPCVHPTMVMQSTWRSGLPLPTPGRNSTPTEHCIIHHSADGNGNSDYTSLVRSYYIHHTQTNGWDDIGYNYLIANDGTLYAGRDPEKSTIQQDNVQGAHFCGKNGKTMGICLIGEYSSIEPSFAAINTLTDLLTWKLDKENFTTKDSFPHPRSSDPKLSVIEGHKAGCNTICPGTNVWNKMEQIRQEVHNKLDQCSSVGISEISKYFSVYPNPTKGKFQIDFAEKTTGLLKITTIDGKEVLSKPLLNLLRFTTSISAFPHGIYFIQIRTGKREYNSTIVHY